MKNKASEKNRTTGSGITEIVFILDRSGSMGGLESDTIGGFNSMLDKQRGEEGKAYVSTILFDHESIVLHDRLPIEKVEHMTAEDYTVRGCTALCDAVGDAVNHISNIHKYARPEDVPERTVFIITTDGMENASRRYSGADLKRLIERQKELGWEFLFIGANIDSISAAENIGIDREYAVNYHADSTGTGVVYEAMCDAVSAVRSGRKLSPRWGAKISEDFNSRKN